MAATGSPYPRKVQDPKPEPPS